jgi:hypothetical protein
VAGCGIGLGNLPIRELTQYSVGLHDRYDDVFRTLYDRMLDLMRRHYRDLEKDHCLVFVKLYDPCDLLVLPSVSSDSDNVFSGSGDEEEDEEEDEEDTEEMDVATEDGSSNNPFMQSISMEANGTADGGSTTATGGAEGEKKTAPAKRRKPSAKKTAPEYLPMKYLGCHVVPTKTLASDLIAYVRPEINALSASVVAKQGIPGEEDELNLREDTR